MKKLILILILLPALLFGQSQGGIIIVGGVSVHQPDTSAYKVINTIQAEGTALNGNNRFYVTYLVTSAKVTGLWSASNAFYGFIGGTSASHKWNWKDMRDLDAAYRLTFSGTFTHSSTGVLPTSASSVASSFLNPSTTLSLNSVHISFYSGTNVQNSFYDISAGSGYRLYGNGSGFIGGNASSATFHQIATSNSLGFYGITRTSSSQSTVFKNGVLNTISNTSTSLPNMPTIIFGEGVTSSQRQSRFVSLGSGLTDQTAIIASPRVTFAQGIISRK